MIGTWLVLVGFLFGYLSKGDYIKPTTEEQFGTLRIPISSKCSVKLKDIKNIKITDMEFVSYDLKISNIDSHKYLKIHHKGYPDAILKVLSEELSNCIPNKSIQYDSSPMLSLDLQEYFDISKSKPIYIFIEDSKAKLVY